MGFKPTLNKRWFWFCLSLVFVCGILCGGVITICGIRYSRSHFPVPVEKISRNLTASIARDFSLDETTKNNVEREVLSLGMEISQHMVETRESIEKSIDRRQESIGALMPDGERKERWMQEYCGFFPRLPYVPIPLNSDR